jgi:hypothetical protein
MKNFIYIVSMFAFMAMGSTMEYSSIKTLSHPSATEIVMETTMETAKGLSNTISSSIHSVVKSGPYLLRYINDWIKKMTSSKVTASTASHLRQRNIVDQEFNTVQSIIEFNSDLALAKDNNVNVNIQNVPEELAGSFCHVIKAHSKKIGTITINDDKKFNNVAKKKISDCIYNELG